VLDELGISLDPKATHVSSDGSLKLADG
jgi:hypothetical protein